MDGQMVGIQTGGETDRWVDRQQESGHENMEVKGLL